MNNRFQSFRSTLFLVGMALSILVMYTSCNSSCLTTKGAGPLVKKTFSAGKFSSISTSLNAHIFISEGLVHSIDIKGQQNILNILNVSNKEGVLEIDFASACGAMSYDELQVYITLPQLAGIEITGSGTAESTDTLHVDKLNIDITGSANVNATIVSHNTITGNITGSGDVTLKGVCDSEDFEITGSGNFHAFDLSCVSSRVDISGSGDAEVNVSKELNTDISGSGSVKYKGNPAVNANTSGSGTVTHVD
jgi:hypothetical protein